MNIYDIQARYHRGDRGALGELYQGFIDMARPVCWCLARQSSVAMDRERVEQLAHDSASRIIERYLRHDRYVIRSFAPVVRLEVLHAFTEGGDGDRPTWRFIHRAEALSPEIPAMVSARSDGDPSTYLQDLVDDHDRGQEIVLALVRGTTYRKAITAVTAVASRRWVYDHAVKLRYVWKLTRRRLRVAQDNGFDDAGCGHRSRGEEAVQGVQHPGTPTYLQRSRRRAASRLLRDRGGR